MKLFAMTLAGLLLAGQAAANGWDATAGVTDAQDLNISGSTAAEYAIRDYILGTLCDAPDGTPGSEIRMYTTTGAYAFAGNKFAIACSVAGVPTADKDVLIRKEGSGGSYKGVKPVCEKSETRNYLTPNNTCNTLTTHDQLVNGRKVDIYTCTANANLEAEGGVSDLGPTEGLQDTSSVCDNVKPAYVVPFGIMVTKKLRDALQLAQNLRPCLAADGGRCSGPDAAGNPVDSGWGARDDDADGIPNEEEANRQPSISNAMMTSLTTGAIPKWSDVAVQDPNNQGLVTALNSIKGLGPLDPDVLANYEACPGGICAAGQAVQAPDVRVTLCHRAQTSGTRAAMVRVMNREGCVSGARPLSVRSGFDAAGPTVMADNAGTGDEEICMTNMNRGIDSITNQTTAPASTTSDSGSLWAIGHVSTDRNPFGPNKDIPAGTNDGYRFIRLDGRFATYENIADGSYPFYGESTAQWMNSQLPNELFLMTNIANGAGNPVLLGTLVRHEVWGDTGVMSLDCPTYVTNGANGVTRYDTTKPSTGLTRQGKNCTVAALSAACDFALESNPDEGSNLQGQPGASAGEDDSDQGTIDIP